MKVPKYLLYLLIPIPVVFGITYYASSQVAPYLKSLFSKKGKELQGVPDFQFQEAELDRRIFEVLALIEFKEKESKPAQSGVAHETPKAPEKPPEYRVQFVFLGKKNYAIIDGRLLKEGDPISTEEKIVKITKKGVLLSGRWGKRWIYLIK